MSHIKSTNEIEWSILYLIADITKNHNCEIVYMRYTWVVNIIRLGLSGSSISIITSSELLNLLRSNIIFLRYHFFLECTSMTKLFAAITHYYRK